MEICRRIDGYDLTPVRPADAEEMGELERICFSDPWSADAFLSVCGNDLYRFFVLREEGSRTLAGYGGIILLGPEAEVANIAVAPAFRGRGLGEDLLSRLTEEAAKNGALLLHLEVREHNIPARSLYEKTGFTVDGIRKNYYRHPTENAILMTKRL